MYYWFLIDRSNGDVACDTADAKNYAHIFPTKKAAESYRTHQHKHSDNARLFRPIKYQLNQKEIKDSRPFSNLYVSIRFNLTRQLVHNTFSFDSSNCVSFNKSKESAESYIKHMKIYKNAFVIGPTLFTRV